MVAVLTSRRVPVYDPRDDSLTAHAEWLRVNLPGNGRGIWPLDAPGMPQPGPDFLRAAAAMADNTILPVKAKRKRDQEILYQPGQTLTELYRRALREVGFCLDIEIPGERLATLPFVPGHLWGQYWKEYLHARDNPRYEAPAVTGPHPSNVMLLGKHPGAEEITDGRYWVGPSGHKLVEMCEDLHIKGRGRWYLGNILKFKPPGTAVRLTAGWINDCRPLLAAELRIVRPSFILCLGGDAAKALLGNKVGVEKSEGIVYEVPIDLRTHPGDPEHWHVALAMVVMHPVQVARNPEIMRIPQRSIARFNMLVQGSRWDLGEKDLTHITCRTLEEVEAWADSVDAEMATIPYKDRWVAWDAEWQGRHPLNEHAFVRCIQASWKDKHAVVIALRDTQGNDTLVDQDGQSAVDRVMERLNRFMEDKRAVLHFGVSDLEWLRALGFDPVAHCPVPRVPDASDKPAWEQLRDGQGWLDLAMVVHAIEETVPLGLKSLSIRYTTAPRYDVKLKEFLDQRSKEDKDALEDKQGFACVPDEILFPYGAYDADVTRRILVKDFLELLDKDYNGQEAWESCWESMIIQEVIYEILESGIQVDRGRIKQLTATFMVNAEKLLQQLRDSVRWPELNPRSVQQVKEMLFGEALNGNKQTKPNAPFRLRPPGARSLGLTPITDTGKPAKQWADLVRRRELIGHSPSTAKNVLNILQWKMPPEDNPVRLLRNWRFLDQVLKGFLRPGRGDTKVTVEEVNDWDEEDDESAWREHGGISAFIDDDGRVRTRFLPTAETGRWRSAKPNLQNVSKTRDKDLEDILGDAYKHKMRSVFCAAPGCALVEFDYIGAELYMMAIMSGDAQMLDHCRRSMLPEDHPDYYDIHSNIAVMAFKLKCAPTKSALEAAGLAHLRNLAKTVVFGLAYGRGAKAIALAARETQKPGDPEITQEDAQAVIDAVFNMYPDLEPFFESCALRSRNERWIANCFKRFRRVPNIIDEERLAEFERQFKNFCIQGGIASLMDRGLMHLQRCRDEGYGRDFFRIVLQMHDAAMLEVPYANIKTVTDDIIPYAFQECVPVMPTHLDGKDLEEGLRHGPYKLGLDITVMHHWNEKYSLEECQRLGIPVRFAAKPKK